MKIFFTSLVFVVQSVLSAPVTDDLIVSLPDGQVQGTTYTTDSNKTYYGFQGIPYATPPVGSLRFEPANKLPVLLWIYGGKFIGGGSQKTHYGPDYLIEEDVIVAMFNYRVGPFGFLSTGDSGIVGNAGLKDQALAIKWVHDNIVHFGGDPDKVTVVGQSAGGASVGLQLVSQKVSGLFRAAIVESGAALTNWSIDRNPKEYADLLTTKLGGEIYLNDTQQLKKFLQGKTALEIVYAAANVGLSSENNQAWPVVEVENDDAFLTESPYELLDSGRFNQVPIIIGICANEAGLLFPDLETAQATALGYDTLPNTIIPSNLRQNSSDSDTVIKAIQNLYLKEGETFSSNLVALTNYQSDHMFTKGITKQAVLTSKYVPVYIYQFAYYGRPIFPPAIPGAEKASHGAEVPFFFNMSYSGPSYPDDIIIQNRMVRLWTNFVKFLNPTPEQTELINVTWPILTATELQFLNINATLEVRAPIRESYKEWNNIYETYGKKPYITF